MTNEPEKDSRVGRRREQFESCTGQKERPAKAFMVVPPRADAARPVDAVTKVESFGKARRMCFSSSDLPVPAQPVKKTLCPCLQLPTYEHICMN